MKSFKALTICFLTTILWSLFSLGLSAQVTSSFERHLVSKNKDHELTYYSSYSGVVISKAVSNGQVAVVTDNGIANSFNIVYTPTTDFTGVDTLVFQYLMFNQSGLFVRQSNIIYDVRGIVLKDDYYVVQRSDDSLLLSVLDANWNDESVTITGIAFDTGCNAFISSDSVIGVVPDKVGKAYFRYSACNESGDCTSATVMLTVVNETTVDTVETMHQFTVKNNRISIHLPGVDFDVIQGPTKGQVVYQSPSIISYTPNHNFVGVDSLEMEFDGGEYTHKLKISLTVLNFDRPNYYIFNDLFFTAVNQPISFNVRVNDLETSTPISNFSQPANGTLSNLGSGNFSYTPNLNFKGIDFFTYRVCPLQYPGCETGTVRIDVNNQKPELGTYQFVTPKNIPYVVKYLIPINTFEFEILDLPLQGDLEFISGQSSFMINGIQIEGYNLLVYTPDEDALGMDEMRVRYCAGNECKDIKLDIEIIDYTPDLICVDNCVWPGDVNNDGRVDMLDLLPLSFYLGHSGEERGSEDPMMWLASAAGDWTSHQVHDGTNLKHADTNGDGIITAVDTSAIIHNYLKHHQFVSATSNPLVAFPFNLTPSSNGPFYEGDTVSFDISVGSTQFPALDIMGLSFELDFPAADFIDLPSIKVDLHKESWLTINAPSLGITIKPEESRIDAGLARADGKFISGFGTIGKLEFIVVRDIDGFHPGGNTIQIPVRMKNGNILTASGRIESMRDVQSSVTMRIIPNEQQKESTLSIFPNPATDEINIAIKGNAVLESIELISLTGQILQSQKCGSCKQTSLNTLSLQNGFYAIRATTSEGVMVSKVQIMK